MSKYIEQVLSENEDIIDSARLMPFSSGRVTVNSDKIKDLINEGRASLPQEIRMSKRILEDRDAIIAGAKKEAETIVQKAEVRAKLLVSNDPITKRAHSQGIELITQAQTKSKMLRESAYDYINSILAESETALTASLTEVKRTRAALKTKTKGK